MKKTKQIYYKLNYLIKLNSKSTVLQTVASDVVEKTHYKEKPSFDQSNSINDEYDLMVIISAYNTDAYIEECIDSLLNQKTKYSVYTVIINDGSTDNTSNILRKYESINNIKIIHQENRGFSGARNRALENINGRYVMFYDSDDTLPENAVESLMSIAIENNADIVAGGYKTFSETGKSNVYSLTDSIKQVNAGDVPGFTCMKVIRSCLLSEFCFPEKYLFEDTVISKLIYPQCEKIYVIPDIVYNYRTRDGSISQSYDTQKECIDTFWITKYCLEEHINRGYPMDETVYKEYLKQCYVNYLRTRYLTQELKESLFVLTAEMLNRHWGKTKIKSHDKFRMLDKALKRNSFSAYKYALDRWDLL